MKAITLFLTLTISFTCLAATDKTLKGSADIIYSTDKASSRIEMAVYGEPAKHLFKALKSATIVKIESGEARLGADYSCKKVKTVFSCNLSLDGAQGRVIE